MNPHLKKIYEELNAKEESITIIKSQVELLKALAKGYTLKVTAKNLDISYYNLQKRTQLLYKKFGVQNRQSLISAALKFNIIPYSDVTNRFRDRFVYNRRIFNVSTPVLNEVLTERELEYLKLASQGKSKKDIIEELGLLNMNFCNYVLSQVCYKLNAKNVTQAVSIACRLKIIN